jgi:molybdopterin-guanine dinucleotide biosynthesis protein A
MLRASMRAVGMNMRKGYVLTGGRSSRFGGDKALVDVAGKPMVVHVADRIRPASRSVTLVGSAAIYGSLGLRVIEDSVSDFGPVAGLLAALEDSTAEWNLIVACDMPNLRADFLEWLFQQAESSVADVVIPLDRDERQQPLCAVYRTGVVAALRDAVLHGTGKVARALEGLSINYLAATEYAGMDPDGDLLLNVNRPGDLPKNR